MRLRPIDKIGIGALLILQGLGLHYLNTATYIIANILLILTGIGIKIFNMYRMTPEQIRERKNEEGLSGLFC